MVNYFDDYAVDFQVKKRNASKKAMDYIKGLVQSTHSNMEKMAESVPGAEYQALQQFLSDSPWSHQAVMNRVATDVNAILNGAQCALLLDETSIPKKGKKSVGVSRQWCGRLGKVDNCQVGVFAALAKNDDVSLIDAELFLPKSWVADDERCKVARIPEEKCVTRTKIDIALDLVKRAKANGLDYGWVSADSFYGRDKNFLYGLDALGETFVMDVPMDFAVYLKPPNPALPPKPTTGRSPSRYQSQAKFTTVKRWLTSIPEHAWKKQVFREGSKGSMTAEVLHERVWIWDGKSGCAHCWHMIARREVGDRTMIKVSVSNAPARTSKKQLVMMQGQRHFIERSFQDGKSQLGLDQYQARNWNAWHHHMALIMMAMLYLVDQKITRKQHMPLYTVADVVYLLIHVLPGKVRSPQDAERVIEERHKRRRQAMESHANTG